MIQVIQKEDNSYSYDFPNLESYISRAEKADLDKQIAIYNLFPWISSFYFFDERTSQIKAFNVGPDSEAYRAFFKPLIQALSEFLERKNWKSKTFWIKDEQGPSRTIALKTWIDEISSWFQFSFASRLSATLAKRLEEYALPVNVSLDEASFFSGVAINWHTLMDTSSFEQPYQPNSLMTSVLRNSYFLAHLANLRGYQGILHWAYNLWSKQIKTSDIFSDVPSGDAHLVYPDGETSVRYLVIQDAIEEIVKFGLISKVQRQSSNLCRVIFDKY